MRKVGRYCRTRGGNVEETEAWNKAALSPVNGADNIKLVPMPESSTSGGSECCYVSPVRASGGMS